MELKLKLLTYGKFDTQTVQLTDNDTLKIAFEGKIINSWSYVAICKNSTTKLSLLVKNGIFDLPKELLTDDTLHIIIEARANGEVVKSYQCEPLNISIIDGQVKVVPEIAEIKALCEQATSLSQTTLEKVEQLKEQCDRTLEIVKLLNGLQDKVV